MDVYLFSMNLYKWNTLYKFINNKYDQLMEQTMTIYCLLLLSMGILAYLQRNHLKHQTITNIMSLMKIKLYMRLLLTILSIEGLPVLRLLAYATFTLMSDKKVDRLLMLLMKILFVIIIKKTV